MMDGWVDKVDLGGGEDTKNYDEIMATKRCKPKLFSFLLGYLQMKIKSCVFYYFIVYPTIQSCSTTDSFKQLYKFQSNSLVLGQGSKIKYLVLIFSYKEEDSNRILKRITQVTQENDFVMIYYKQINNRWKSQTLCPSSLCKKKSPTQRTLFIVIEAVLENNLKRSDTCQVSRHQGPLARIVACLNYRY